MAMRRRQVQGPALLRYVKQGLWGAMWGAMLSASHAAALHGLQPIQQLLPAQAGVVGGHRASSFLQPSHRQSSLLLAESRIGIEQVASACTSCALQ